MGERYIDDLRLGVEADTDDCVIWPHGRNKNGYGVCYPEDRRHARYVHRMVFELQKGRIRGVAGRFGVDESVIRAVRVGRTWRAVA